MNAANSFSNSSVSVELKNLHVRANRATLFKTFLAIATLVTSIVIPILFGYISFMWGTGLGLAVISSYALTYYHHQYKENKALFRNATSALNQP